MALLVLQAVCMLPGRCMHDAKQFHWFGTEDPNLDEMPACCTYFA